MLVWEPECYVFTSHMVINLLYKLIMFMGVFIMTAFESKGYCSQQIRTVVRARVYTIHSLLCVTHIQIVRFTRKCTDEKFTRKSHILKVIICIFDGFCKQSQIGLLITLGTEFVKYLIGNQILSMCHVEDYMLNISLYFVYLILSRWRI